MSCVYLYKGHTFNSEEALNDFLIEKSALYSKYGDIVFERSTIHSHVLDILDKAGADSQELRDRYNKAKESYYDGETSKELELPFVGVNKFLSGLRNSENKLLFPEFIENEYWSRRRIAWESADFTDDEKELFFDDPKNIKAIKKSEADHFQKMMEEKWENQAIIGTELHKILQIFFSTIKTGANAGKIMGSMSDSFLLNTVFPRKLNMDLVNPKAIADTLKIARDLHSQIINKFGEDCSFHPEFTITGKSAKEVEGKGDTLLGMIDLLVIDSKGNSHIIDYKTSPKPYDKYSEAKKLAFSYQIAVYNRILNSYGINTDDSEMLVVPIQMQNFRKEGDIYVYDGVNPIQKESTNSLGQKIDSSLWESIKNRVEHSVQIQNNLDEFFPPKYLDSPTTENLTQEVQEAMSAFFTDYSSNKHQFTDEEIKKELDDAGAFNANEKGLYIYTIGNKEIVANSPEELFKKVKTRREKIANYRVRTAKNISYNLKNAIKTENPNLELPKLDGTHHDGNPNWLNNKLAKYCNHNWKVIENDAALNYGIIILQNVVSGQLDFIRISCNDIRTQKHFGGKDRYGITGTFESDIVEQSKSKSLILSAKEGNVELIETMLVINKLQNLFNKSAVIGSIEVINPFHGHDMTASNEELLYSFNALTKYHPLKENNFKSKINMATKYQLAYNTFQDIITIGNRNKWAGDFTKFKDFESSLSMHDLSIDTSIDEKIEQLEKLRNKLENTYDLQGIYEEQSQLNSNHISLYNKVLIALADLKGVNFRQQVQKNDAWLESFLVNKKGVNGLLIDNPGNLASDTLNLLTRLTTEAYQNVRSSMQKPKAEIRQFVDAIKAEHSYGYLQEHTIGNAASLYSKMIRETQDGNILFKNVNDTDLSENERKFLKYALKTINKNRFPTRTDQELKMMEDNGSVEYYQIPLAKGDFTSKAATDGLLEAFKDKLKELNPRESIKRAKDKLEGINRIEEQSSEEAEKRRASNLFEMGVGFDRGEGAERIDYIKKMGKGYFEQNLETLLLKHIFQYQVKANMDKVFPMMKAAMAHLSIQGANFNEKFTSDVKYLKDYIVNKVKNESIIDPKYEYAADLVSKVKQAASVAMLAFSPVQGLYQSIQGLWTDIRLIIQKPDIINKHGKSAFTFKNMSESFKTAYKDLFVSGNKNTVNSLINELYGLNDMDMNQYVDRLKTDKFGMFNFSQFMFKMSQRPDYYNRLTIFGAQMRADGTWNAHSIKDGILYYDIKKDKRFSAFVNGDIHNPDYNKQKVLFYSVAKQFELEHAKNADGSDYKLDMSKPNLPRAYTNQQAESYKSLSDDIYGYYSHEKKSLINSTLLGSIFMQFKTFWTGKKNQYLSKGGVKLRGEYQQYEENGEKYYYQVDDNGNILFNEAPLSESQMKEKGLPLVAPFMQWKGQWQEGIILTMSNIFSLNPKQFAKNITEMWYNDDPMLRNVYRSNVKQLAYDFTIWMMGGVLLAGLLGDWLKELKEDNKDSNDLSTACKLAAANIFVASMKNSFLDFNTSDSLFSPVTSWTPVSFEWSYRTVKNVWNIGMGNTDFWDGVVKSYSALKSIKPGLDIIKPKEN